MMSWVPQFLYDFLARIVPGFILLSAGALVFRGSVEASKKLFVNALTDQTTINPWALLFLMLPAYLLSFVLAEVWDSTLRKMLGQKKWQKKRAFKRMLRDRLACQCGLIGHDHSEKPAAKSAEQKRETPPVSKTGSDSRRHTNDDEKIRDIHPEHIPDIFYLRDQLRLVSPSTTRLLLKLRSESRQCEVLVLGFSILFLLSIGRGFRARLTPLLLKPAPKRPDFSGIAWSLRFCCPSWLGCFTARANGCRDLAAPVR